MKQDVQNTAAEKEKQVVHKYESYLFVHGRFLAGCLVAPSVYPCKSLTTYVSGHTKRLLIANNNEIKNIWYYDKIMRI